jgi:uncharacterized protein (DUF362 family)
MSAMTPFRLGPSPFADAADRPRVEVGRGPDAYALTRAVLGRFDLGPAAGKRVLLKPNAGRLAKPGSGVCTNADVVAAAIDAFREAGAEVAVGESPISGVKTPEAFAATGIAAVCDVRTCPMIDMDERPPVRVELPEGVAIQELQLCAEMLEYDLIVSIPVMKMHMHTGVTLALKNMKGCLWRRSKVKLHLLPPVPEFPEELSINVAIADLTWALRPHFSILDGTVGMEGLGPSAGAPKRADLIVAGAEPFAADAVACALMGLSAADVPHLRLAAARGYGVIDLAQIDVRPDTWQSLVANFAGPPKNLEISFPGIRVLDRNSCSACQSTLLLFLKHYREKILDYFPPGEVSIVIGKGNENVPDHALCLGNCAARHRGKGIFVPGCPPVSSEILTVLSGHQQYDLEDAGREAVPVYDPPDAPDGGKAP